MNGKLAKSKSEKLVKQSVEALDIPGLDNIERFNQWCIENPDAIPQAVTRTTSQIQYTVGYWWLALPEGIKNLALERNPVFVELYSPESCKRFASICKKIPGGNRFPVVSNVPIRHSMLITSRFSEPENLEFLFNFVLENDCTAKELETIINVMLNSKMSPPRWKLTFSQITSNTTRDRITEMEKLESAVKQEDKSIQQLKDELEQLKSLTQKTADSEIKVKQLARQLLEKESEIARLKLEADKEPEKIEVIKTVEIEKNPNLQKEYNFLQTQIRNLEARYKNSENNRKELLDKLELAKESRYQPTPNNEVSFIDVTPQETSYDKEKKSNTLLVSTMSVISQEYLEPLLQNPHVLQKDKLIIRDFIDKIREIITLRK